MSSTAYFAEIFPEPGLRRLVLASGAALVLAGLLLIRLLPVALELRAIAALAWAVLGAYESVRIRQAWNACHAIRFSADGSVAVLVPGQTWQPGTLLPGGVLLPGVGWLRLLVALPEGEKLMLAELVRGDGRESADWRRLQVIWRHIGA